jgi:chromosome condensin MukBEF complex kleisin-like MukF subunit
MLTYEDCLALCDLTEEEIDAVAEHEHLPAIVAAEYANYLCHRPEGEARIQRFIVDDIARAQAHGDRRRALALKLVLKRFLEHHPRARGDKPAKPV